MTVREQVSTILATINANFKQLAPHECAEYANVLASLLSTILEKEAEAEGLCNMYKVTLLDDPDNDYSVAETDTRMKATKEYQEYRKVRAMRIGVEETIKTLKKRIEAVTFEERNL